MPGLRIENENFRSWGLNTRDIVPWLSTTMKFPLMESMILGREGRAEPHDCGWQRGFFSPTLTSVTLHDKGEYVARASRVNSTLDYIANVGLMHSYNTDTAYVAAAVRERGWGLVTSVLVNETEISHLIQNPETLDCILTFEGTDTAEDWWTDLNYFRTTFCGFEGVHSGYVAEFTSLVEGAKWQTFIKPQLNKCRKVQTVGHSLGGALATLFTACALTAPVNDVHYPFVHWTPEEPELMPFM